MPAKKKKSAPKSAKKKPSAKSVKAAAPPAPAALRAADGLDTLGQPSMTDADWDAFFRITRILLNDASTLGVFVAQDYMHKAANDRGATGQLMEFFNVYQ